MVEKMLYFSFSMRSNKQVVPCHDVSVEEKEKGDAKDLEVQFKQ